MSSVTQDASCTTKVSAGGRIVIPADVRKELGIETGDKVMLRVEDGMLSVYSPRHELRKFQQRVQELVPGDVSLADELIRERRREADDE